MMIRNLNMTKILFIRSIIVISTQMRFKFFIGPASNLHLFFYYDKQYPVNINSNRHDS